MTDADPSVDCEKSLMELPNTFVPGGIIYSARAEHGGESEGRERVCVRGSEGGGLDGEMRDALGCVWGGKEWG